MTRLPATTAQRAASTLWLFGLLGLGRCNDAHGPRDTTPGDNSVEGSHNGSASDGGRGVSGDAGAPNGAGTGGSAGSSAGAGGSTAGAAGSSHGCFGSALDPSRTLLACPATRPPGATDAGSMACSTDADCPASDLQRWCRGGQCQADQCLTDDECSTGEACACAPQLGGGGNFLHTNLCVPAGCRVNADCGGGSVCSATWATGPCSGVVGYACHTAEDTCSSNAECCRDTPDTPICNYQPALGHWACEAATFCNG